MSDETIQQEVLQEQSSSTLDALKPEVEEPLVAASVESMAAQLTPEPEVEETQIVEIVSAGSLPNVWNVHVRYVNDAGDVSDTALMFGRVANSRDVFPLWQSKTDLVAARVKNYKGILLVPCPEIVSV